MATFYNRNDKSHDVTYQHLHITFGGSYRNTEIGLPGAHSSLIFGLVEAATDSTHSSSSYDTVTMNTPHGNKIDKSPPMIEQDS